MDFIRAHPFWLNRWCESRLMGSLMGPWSNRSTPFPNSSPAKGSIPMVTPEKAAGLAKKLKSFRLRASKLLPQGVSSESEATANPQQLPFAHLLRSNIPPTETESSLIRDVITTAKVEESRLKEMVSNHSESDRLTSEAVRNLNCEIDRTRQHIVEHKAILSSIRRIPPEVLQNIFIHTLPTTTDDPIPGSKILCNSQLSWAVSQVCQLWRNIMLSFSVMWKDLPVVDLNKVYTKEKPYLDFLTEMLERSHNTPIRFVILGNVKEHIANHPAIGLLVLHSDRWHEVRIHALLVLLPALQNIKGHLSSLQSLYLSLYSTEISDPMNHTPHDLFRIAPNLRCVELVRNTCQFDFPAHQFVHYSQNRASLHQVIQIVSSSPSLRILKFHGFQHAVPTTLPTTAFSLPDLTVLDAHFYPVSPFQEAFFDNLTIPAIAKLRVQSQADNVITPICSMILRSGSLCLLKVLHLRLRFTPGTLPSLLRLTPLLTHLSITLPPIQDIFALMLDGNTPLLVPLLDECEFLQSYSADLSTEIVEALKLLASSRCELPDNATSAQILQSGGCQHALQTLRIHCGARKPSWPRPQFEGWAYGDMADELDKKRQRLLDMLPHLGPRNIKGNLRWTNQVTGLLTHLETLEIETASDICVSVHSSPFCLIKSLNTYFRCLEFNVFSMPFG